MKQCNKCRKIKEEVEFYLDKASKDGLRSSCRQCMSDYSKKRYTPKLTKRSINPIPWHIRNPEKRAEVIKRYNDTHKLELKIQMDGLRKKWPQKWNARSKINYAIRSGKLKREPCEVCGTVKVEAHHVDYEKPFEIVWLCRKHHIEADKKLTNLHLCQN